MNTQPIPTPILRRSLSQWQTLLQARLCILAAFVLCSIGSIKAVYALPVRIDLASHTAWTFRPDGAGLRPKALPVPGGGWRNGGFPNTSGGTYQRQVAVPRLPGPGAQVTLLEFESIVGEAIVRVGPNNNRVKEVGRHLYSWTPFRLDVSAFVIPGRTALLEVHVRNVTGSMVSGNLSNGILRGVSLIVYPRTYIDSVLVKPSTVNNTLSYEVTIVNAGQSRRTVMIGGRLGPAMTGSHFPYPILPLQTVSLMPGETGTIAFGPVPWKADRSSWWWPNVPYRTEYRAQLHILTLDLRGEPNSTGALLQTESVRFGFCTASTNGNSCIFNGVPFPLRGDNLSEAAIGADAFSRLPGFLAPSKGNPGWPWAVRNYQRLNFNVISIHEIPSTRYMMDVCDELGMLLIDEPATPPLFSGVSDAASKTAARQSYLNEVMLRNRNHPCVLPLNLPSDPPTIHQLIPVQFSLTARALRGQGKSDVRICTLTDIWPGVIPGNSPAQVAKPVQAHVSSDPPSMAPLEFSDPRTAFDDARIDIIRRSYAPVAVFDPKHDASNIHSNGRGEWPTTVPQAISGQRLTCILDVFNDEFDDRAITLILTPALRIKKIVDGAIKDEQEALPEITTKVSVPLGEFLRVPVELPLPIVDRNTALEITVTAWKAGIQQYREVLPYVIVPEGSAGSTATFEGRDEKTSGNWLDNGGRAIYGKQAFLIPISGGRSGFQTDEAFIRRVLEIPTVGPTSGQVDELNEQDGYQLLEKTITVSDDRVLWNGPDKAARYPVAMRGVKGTIRLRIDTTDGLPHRVSLYLLDYARQGLAVDVDIFDLQGHRLDSRRFDDYRNGVYANYRIRGTIYIAVHSLDQVQPLLSGIFVDPAA